MKEKIKQGLAWIIAIIIASSIGAGMMMVVGKAIKYTQAIACYDYKDPEVCKEALK